MRPNLPQKVEVDSQPLYAASGDGLAEAAGARWMDHKGILKGLHFPNWSPRHERFYKGKRGVDLREMAQSKGIDAPGALNRPRESQVLQGRLAGDESPNVEGVAKVGRECVQLKGTRVGQDPLARCTSPMNNSSD
jgi:hypothetical protein